jgi:cob(I)alamin adenosyltransferase
MTIYTRRGDSGQTDLFSGERVAKSGLRIETYGTVDELNANIGCLLAGLPDGQEAVRAELTDVQSRLFSIGSRLATTTGSEAETRIPAWEPEAVALLEAAIDRMQSALPALEGFILPGGAECAARAHVSRTVCRRAERCLVRFLDSVTIESNAPLACVEVYLNRLSDYLFALARHLNHAAGKSDIRWRESED